MIAYSSRDAVNVSFGASGRMLKRVNAGSVVQPSASALLIAGPAHGEASVETEGFVISADGALSGTVTVALAWTGVPNTPSALSVTLTPAAPTASVTSIPSTTGTLTLTATASGLTPAVATYSVDVAAPVVDFNEWSYKIDPELAFESSWGNNPQGDALKPRLQLEFDADSTDTSIQNVSLDDTAGTYDGSASVRGVTLTSTEAQKGSTTPTFATLGRISDPAGGGFTVFKHQLKKTEHPWAVQKKWRNALVLASTAPRNPWGTTLWSVLGYFFDAAQLATSSSEAWQWDLIASMHQGESSRIRGGGLNFELIGGNGDPTQAALMYTITAYANPNWLSGDYSNASTYITEPRRAVFLRPTVDAWHYLIIQSRLGCGYSDPTHGAIYGSLGPYSGGTGDGSEYFVRIWHAIDDGAPVASITPYTGYWGGPHNPAHTFAAENELIDGTLTNVHDQAWADLGIYGMLGTADAECVHIHRGCKVWVHQDGMDPIKVLNAFRT